MLFQEEDHIRARLVTLFHACAHPISPADLMAEGLLLKLGKRLAVLEVTLHSDGHDEPVAHATGTYSIPPEPP